jgi:hypothetical protein
MMGVQWWVQDNGLGILPGNATVGGNGYAGNQTASGAVQFRSPLDQARAASGKVPYAEYPDGYLGNIINRRSDRLIQAVKERLTAQSYQRGVHKGSRIEAKEYFWPSDQVNPDSGLERQSIQVRDDNVIRTQRFAPIGNPVERLAHMGKTSGMATPGMLGQKMQEARDMGSNPVTNPIVLQDPNLRPRYKTS